MQQATERKLGEQRGNVREVSGIQAQARALCDRREVTGRTGDTETDTPRLYQYSRARPRSHQTDGWLQESVE